MRKIDAVLLSALIIYDYSAQSLADSEAIKLGHSFTAENNRLQTPVDSFSARQSEYLHDTAASVLDDNDITSTNTVIPPITTISYHELSQLSAVKSMASPQKQSQKVDAESKAEDVMISIPVAHNTDIEFEQPETITAVQNNYSVQSVTINNKDAAIDLRELDSDNDGVFDYEDKCPGTAGVARFEGCPVPDSDGDGINDEEDRCPNIAGSTENGGCPLSNHNEQTIDTSAPSATPQTVVAREAVKNLSFTSTPLTDADFNSLTHVAQSLINNATAKIDISYFGKTPENVEKIVSFLKSIGVSNEQVQLINSDEKPETAKSDSINIQIK